MPVITLDALVEGVRREAVFDWLADPAVFPGFLRGGFSSVEPAGDRAWELTFVAPPGTQTMTCRYLGEDREHGGRRVVLRTEGRRLVGDLRLSLRTVKPSTNTLVTLHHDYAPVGTLGALLRHTGLNASLERAWRASLEGLVRAVAAAGWAR